MDLFKKILLSLVICLSVSITACQNPNKTESVRYLDTIFGNVDVQKD